MNPFFIFTLPNTWIFQKVYICTRFNKDTWEINIILMIPMILFSNSVLCSLIFFSKSVF